MTEINNIGFQPIVAVWGAMEAGDAEAPPESATLIAASGAQSSSVADHGVFGSAARPSPALLADVERVVADAMGVMLAAQARMQQANGAVGSVQVMDAQERQRAAQEAFQRAGEAVERLAKKHGGLFHKKWFKNLIKVVAAVVAVAATVVSFGSAGPLAIAGLVLILGADLITKGLVEAGIVPKDKAVWVAMAIKLVGVALTLGAGAAAGGAQAASTGVEAGSSAAQVASVIKNATDVIQGVLTLVTLGEQVDGAVIQHMLGQARATATLERDRVDESGEDVEEGVAILQEVQSQHARIMGRISDMQTVREQSHDAVVSMQA